MSLRELEEEIRYSLDTLRELNRRLRAVQLNELRLGTTIRSYRAISSLRDQIEEEKERIESLLTKMKMIKDRLSGG